jgi:hypothetical protein
MTSSETGEISTSIDSIIGKMVARSQGVHGALLIAAHRIAPIVERDSRRVLNEDIYSIPEKRTKKGKPRWIRTVRLLQAEHAEVQGVDVSLVNNMYYAAPRYHLGDFDPGPPTKVRRGGRPRQVCPPQRATRWQWKAVMMAREFILEARRRAILRMLGAPK